MKRTIMLALMLLGSTAMSANALDSTGPSAAITKPPRPDGQPRAEVQSGSLKSSRGQSGSSATGQLKTTGSQPSDSPALEQKPGQAAKLEQRPPKPPIDTALDTNQDDVISATEIAVATSSLKKLDKNGDGRLSADECLPSRPLPPAGGQTTK